MTLQLLCNTSQLATRNNCNPLQSRCSHRLATVARRNFCNSCKSLQEPTTRRDLNALMYYYYYHFNNME